MKIIPHMQNILVSVSGGKTSLYLAKRIHDDYHTTHNVIFVFANTGAEHPETLEFLHRAETMWGIHIIWLEAVVHEGRKATTHKVVNYHTADREGKVFEKVVRKYGIPNVSWGHCNREMKLNVIHSFASGYFGCKEYQLYQTVIGIRCDEVDRVAKDRVEKHKIYPLVSQYPTTKKDVQEFWNEIPWRLNIPEHYGNCLTCFKKSDRKLVTIVREHPEFFKLFKRLEFFSHIGPDEGERQFYRKKRTIADIFELAKDESIQSFTDDAFIPFNPELDVDEPCGHDCLLT